MRRIDLPASGQMTVPSPREAQILRHVATGKTDKEIAAALGISVGTVKQRVFRMRQHLGLPSRPELHRWVLQHPAVLEGRPVDPTLHPCGCMCPAVWCAAVREAQRAVGPPVVDFRQALRSLS